MQAVLNQSGRQQPKLWESGKNAIAFLRRVQPAVFSISFDSWGGFRRAIPGQFPIAPKVLAVVRVYHLEPTVRRFIVWATGSFDNNALEILRAAYPE